MSISDDDLVSHLVEAPENPSAKMGLLILGMIGQVEEGNPVHNTPHDVPETPSVILSGGYMVEDHHVEGLGWLEPFPQTAITILPCVTLPENVILVVGGIHHTRGVN